MRRKNSHIQSLKVPHSKKRLICTGIVFCGVNDEFKCYHSVPHESSDTCSFDWCDSADAIEIGCVRVRTNK